MSLLIGALTIGLILSLLGVAVYISFKIFSFPDMSCEGSFTLGAAVCAVLLIAGWGALPATLAGMCAGAFAGMLTGLIHTRLNINALLAGILVMTALYSVNLRIMGSSNLPLTSVHTFADAASDLGKTFFGDAERITIFGRTALVHDVCVLLAIAAIVLAVTAILLAFFATHAGLAMRATGDNSQMIRALGVSDGTMQTIGLALSNALAALAGSLMAQFQGFCDVQMGIGMLVAGLAAVILGEALVGGRKLSHFIIGTLLGALLFRLLVAVALRVGLEPNDLKLITALFVLLALVSPMLLKRLRTHRAPGAAHA
jgi:putative ABC transport system permease protein